VKILTFNLKGFDNRPRKGRSEAFVALAAPEKPDVILLQEGVGGLVAGTWCSIAQVVRMFAGYGLPYKSTVCRMTGYPGILTYTLGILTLRQHTFLGVEEIHNVPMEWEGLFPWYRKIMGVRCGGVNFYTTHFGGGTESGQMRQAGDALSFIKRTGSQLAVFGGDFNFIGGPAHELIQSRVFYEGGGGRIDKFYIRGFPSATCEILFNDPAISDHPCVMATLN